MIELEQRGVNEFTQASKQEDLNLDSLDLLNNVHDTNIHNGHN